MSANDIPAFQAAPGVLISVPQMDDPNFARSVVMMLLHDEEGALGLVINMETPITCADVAEMFGHPWPGDSDAKLLKGGPVDVDGLWLAHDGSVYPDDSLPALEGICTSRSEEAFEALCVGGSEPLVMGIGCAGWGPGQLEGEMAAGAWIHAPVTPAMAFEWPREEVWERALATLGIKPEMLVTGGGMQ